MKKNKYIYYGILFYFLYIQIFNISSSLLITPILIFQFNIHLILILLFIYIVLLSFLFYRFEKFPKIKIWFIVLIVIVTTLISFFNIPEKFYLTDTYFLYVLEKKSMIMNYILICKTINTIVFLVIAYIKYLKLKE